MRCALIFLLFGIVFECHVVKRQAANDVFRDVVRQKTRGNQIQQCPCVIHPESRQCISYDSRYIAVNYEEAILSFLDLTKHHVDPAPLINSNTFSCTSQECQQCFSLLYHKLGDIGFIPGSYRSSIAPLPKSQLNPSRCPRYNFPVPIVPPVPPSNVPSYMQSLINAGKQFRNANSHSRSSLGNPPAASPPIPSSNRNNNNRNNNNANQNNQSPRNQNQNQNQNQNHNHNQNQNSRNPNPNQNQNQNRPNNNSGRQNFNQNNQNNQLQNQRTQFRNNQAMRNRFNAQQRANNAFQNTQRPFQLNQNFQNVQRPWQGQQQQFQQPQFQNTRPLQNFNGQQLQWNGRFWEPAGHAITEAIRNPIQNAVGNGWSNGWGGGQQGNAGNGGFPQAPVVVQPAPVQTLPWTGGAGDGFGGGGHVGGGWGGGGGQNQNNNGFFGGLFGGGFKQRHKRAPVPTIIGQRFTINCMARGDSEDDILALCGSCWTWRQLPDNYFPRIINELSCKPDDYCLSGWGECVQQYRNVDVLRRDNGRWVPTVITTSTCCDCRVRAGTEIHSLVIGDKH